MPSVKTANLSAFTRLPLEVIEVGGRLMPDVFARTPHRGKVQVKLKEEHYPFIFGSVTQTEKHAMDVIRELRELEMDARDYLFKKWLSELSE